MIRQVANYFSDFARTAGVSSAATGSPAQPEEAISLGRSSGVFNLRAVRIPSRTVQTPHTGVQPAFQVSL